MNNIDDGTGKKETRIKLIRNESIGNYSWDTSVSTLNFGYGVNEWSESAIMRLLNSEYEYESINGSLYWNRQKGMCYNGESNATTSCDFTSSGLTKESKSLISTAVWNTGSNGNEIVYDVIKTTRFYELERSSNTGKICTNGDYCNDSVTRKKNWTGQVGLIYPSDYGYATSGSNEISREICLDTILANWDKENTKGCRENNWLYFPNFSYWSLIPGGYQIYATGVFNIYGDGKSYMNSAYFAHAIFPVLYLKSNIKIIGGNGSESNAFVLSLD